MSSISDSERREVAAKLRSVANAGCLGFQGGVYCALGMLPENSDDMTWPEYTAYNNRVLLNRLADLIDRPTCHMEYRPEWSGDELYPTRAYECSVCGQVAQDGKPDYCPGCGAEVVE